MPWNASEYLVGRLVKTNIERVWLKAHVLADSRLELSMSGRAQVHLACHLVRVCYLRDGVREARGGHPADDHLVTNILPGEPVSKPQGF